MKRNILILFSVFATLCFPARADGIVTFDSKQLPSKARIFLMEHFPEAQISHIKIEKEFLRVSKYEVLLTNRTEVEFDRDGEWLEVECDRMQVPDALIPAYVSEYLGKYFPIMYCELMDSLFITLRMVSANMSAMLNCLTLSHFLE